MSRMASPGSQLPGGFILGALSHADRIGLVYEAFPSEGRGQKARALVLHPLHVDELRDWFERTAVLGRGLKHTNLVEVHALGYTANQLPVMITEWTEGRTLRSRLAGGEVIVVPEIRRIIGEVAAALDYLHGRSPPVLHRVLMPETVLIPPTPLPVKLLAVGHADRPQHPASKANYLSPEELEGHSELTPAADVFSLATLAFEALTGRPAFPGNNPGAVLNAVQRRQLPYIALGPQEGLESLDELLQRGWSLDPARRPASAGAFAAELGEALESVSSTLLTSRRTLREGAPRVGTIPPIAGAMGRPGTTRYPTPIPTGARVSTRPPAMAARGQGARPISPLIGSNSHAPPRIGTAPGHSGLPPRSASGGAELSSAYRRGDEDANSWLNLDATDRAARPSALVPELVPPSAAEMPTPPPGPLDAGDAEITTGFVDIDDPEVLELLSEDFTSPAIASLLPRVFAEPRPAQFEGDFTDAPPPAPPQPPQPRPSSRPPPPQVTPAPRSRFPAPVRSLTQPAGFPVGLQRQSPAPMRVERPQQYDRPPISPFAPAEARPRDDVASAQPWHSRELKVTPWLIAVVLALNLVLTGALLVVMRHFLV
ncbi:MAG: protein kinase [Deltaproteobacteria bacterium]|nr:protein kinase [Myxococcales bacterium]MDP3219454.1 protein kinase [Deltaproteobacteria bacterium]